MCLRSQLILLETTGTRLRKPMFLFGSPSALNESAWDAHHVEIEACAMFGNLGAVNLVPKSWVLTRPGLGTTDQKIPSPVGPNPGLVTTRFRGHASEGRAPIGKRHYKTPPLALPNSRERPRARGVLSPHCRFLSESLGSGGIAWASLPHPEFVPHYWEVLKQEWVSAHSDLLFP